MKNTSTGQEPKKVDYVTQGFGLGLVLGAGWGVVLSAALDNPAFIAIGVGCGISLGLAIGTSLQRRHEEGAGSSEGVFKHDGGHPTGEDGSS